jgi:hypothetical protein
MVEVIRVAASESVRATASRSTPARVVSILFDLGDPSSHTHDVRLSSNSDQSIDVLADGHQYLSSHVPTLLCPWCLILNMNTRRTLLNEELGELHDSRQTSMTGICVCDYWSQVIDVGAVCAIGLGGREALFALLSVVEKLSHKEVLYFIGHGSLRGVSLCCVDMNWVVTIG